jgi:hypothetical protein
MPKNETADYIQSCVTELAVMARAANLDLLAMLLTMAAAESASVIDAAPTRGAQLRLAGGTKQPR